MNIIKYLLVTALMILSLTAIPAQAKAPLTLDLRTDAQNPTEPTMGDQMRFCSTITNTGLDPINGLVAWISLVEIDPGNEQPVDLEDWSAHKAVTGATLGPGQSLRTDWPMRLIKGGDYRVVVSLTDRNSQTVFTSPTIGFHVRRKPVLQTKRVLPVVIGMPLLVIGLMMSNVYRRRRVTLQ